VGSFIPVSELERIQDIFSVEGNKGPRVFAGGNISGDFLRQLGDFRSVVRVLAGPGKNPPHVMSAFPSHPLSLVFSGRGGGGGGRGFNDGARGGGGYRDAGREWDDVRGAYVRSDNSDGRREDRGGPPRG
jgi:hypothetical protein